MPDEMVGPWRRKDYESFIALDTELNPRLSEAAVRALSLGIKFDPRQAPVEIDQGTVDQAWDIRRKHPIYRWLNSQKNFQDLWRLFEKLRAKAIPKSDLANPTAPFKFLSRIVESAFWLFVMKDIQRREPDSKNYGATKERRKIAKKYINGLLDLSEHGVSIEGGVERQQFEKLLRKFRDELERLKRKPRGGPRCFEKNILEGLAFGIYFDFRLSAPTIVELFAAMANVECDIRTATRYFNAAKKKYRTMLAKELAKVPGQKILQI